MVFRVLLVAKEAVSAALIEVAANDGARRQTLYA
jgi:hypothetical protein